MRLLGTILFLLSFIIVTYATNAGLTNVGNTCYMNTALQALASVPAVSNLILSVDSEALTVDASYKSVLVKLQTILYALRSETVRLDGSYLSGFRDAVSAVSGDRWLPGKQMDEAEFYHCLLGILESHLLPADKLDSFRSLLCAEEATTMKYSSGANKVVTNFMKEIVISGAVGDVTSVQNGLTEFFSPETVVTSEELTRQTFIKTPPLVLSILVNRVKSGVKIDKTIEIPDRLKIEAYKFPGSTWEASEYELRYVAVHSGSSSKSGHYYGYKKDNGRWIELNDSSVSISSSDVTKVTSKGSSTAHMLHYVHVGQKDYLLKAEPIPVKVMAQINKELGKKAVEKSDTSSTFSSSSSGSSGSSSSFSSGSSSGSSGSSSGSSGSSSSSSGSSSSSSGSSSSSSGSSSRSSPSPSPSPSSSPPPSIKPLQGPTSSPVDAQVTAPALKKFSWSWFGLRNDSVSLKPELLPFASLLAIIMLVVN